MPNSMRFGAKWPGQGEDLYRTRPLHVGATWPFLVAQGPPHKGHLSPLCGGRCLCSQSHAAGLLGAYHHIAQYLNPDGPLEVVDVTGSSVENNDKFAKHRELPQVRVGDTIIHDAGAHGFSMATITMAASGWWRFS